MIALLLLLQGDVAARVDGRPILWADVEKRLPDGYTDELRYATLRLIVEERLFLQAGEREGLEVTDRDLDAQLEQDIKRAGGDAGFRDLLRRLNMTSAEYRQWLRAQVFVNGLQGYVSQVWVRDNDWPALHENITPEEIREYYASHKTQFFAVDEVRVAALEVDDRALAESLRRKAGQGSDFEGLAEPYGGVRRSMEPGTAYAGLAAGDLAPVVERDGRFTLALIESVNRRDARSLGDATPTIRSLLVHERRNENRRRLRDFLLERARVEPIDLFR